MRSMTSSDFADLLIKEYKKSGAFQISETNVYNVVGNILDIDPKYMESVENRLRSSGMVIAEYRISPRVEKTFSVFSYSEINKLTENNVRNMRQHHQAWDCAGYGEDDT